MIASQHVIALEALSKYYGSTVGIKQLSFTVEPGEIFGFLGPNGAGKTTTIRLLVDLLRPSSGQVRIFGKALPAHSLEIRGRCGYLPGHFSAYGNMTGAEFLRLAGHFRKLHAPADSDLLSRLELSTRELSKKIKHLSHGQHQKLGLVQAFFHKPELLILDEPTIGLDPLMQETFYKLLWEAQERGCTVFFSSHNLQEVERVCDRVAIIRGGELVALERLQDLKKKRFRRLKLTLREPVDDLKLLGAELLEQSERSYEFLVTGGIEELLRDLAQLPVQDFVFPEPGLEEVFMAYYRRSDDE